MLKITFSKLFENVLNNAIKVNDFLIIINTVIVLHGESFGRVNFSSLTSSSWNLFSTLANHSLHPQKCHYNGL